MFGGQQDVVKDWHEDDLVAEHLDVVSGTRRCMLLLLLPLMFGPDMPPVNWHIPDAFACCRCCCCRCSASTCSAQTHGETYLTHLPVAPAAAAADVWPRHAASGVRHPSHICSLTLRLLLLLLLLLQMFGPDMPPLE
jgi:hypothetical protein